MKNMTLTLIRKRAEFVFSLGSRKQRRNRNSVLDKLEGVRALLVQTRNLIHLYLGSLRTAGVSPRSSPQRDVII